jgi:hypothetical protein
MIGAFVFLRVESRPLRLPPYRAHLDSVFRSKTLLDSKLFLPEGHLSVVIYREFNHTGAFIRSQYAEIFDRRSSEPLHPAHALLDGLFHRLRAGHLRCCSFSSASVKGIELRLERSDYFLYSAFWFLRYCCSASIALISFLMLSMMLFWLAIALLCYTTVSFRLTMSSILSDTIVLPPTPSAKRVPFSQMDVM